MIDIINRIDFNWGIYVWLSVIIITLLVVVIILAWLLVRREKALQLAQFSMSTAGLKLTFELNKDKKLEILALENRALIKEVEVLKKQKSNSEFKSVITISILLFIIWLQKIMLKKEK